MRTKVTAPYLLAFMGVTLFIVSTCIFIVSLSSDMRRLAMERWEEVMGNGVGVVGEEATGGLASGGLSVTTIVSLFASFGSMIAFLSTTMLAWRKERRETRLNGLELERLNLEIAKLRVELEEGGKLKVDLPEKGGLPRPNFKKESAKRTS